jgi:glycosyltransferase involved in cell wall biosynthesis
VNVAAATLVSVIIPTFNAERFLADAAQSALAQDHPDLEVLVVDDGSGDGTLDVARRLAGASDRVRVIHQENAGPAAARNRGIREVAGEFIAFLDADDLWHPTKVRKQLDAFRSNPELGLVYCRREGKRLDSDDQWVPDEERNLRYAERAAAGRFYRGRCFDKVITESFIALSSVMIPRRVLDDVGLFDTELITAEDRHLYARIAHDYPIECVDEPLVVMRRHGANISWAPDREPQTLDFVRKIADEFPECSLDSSAWMRRVYADAARQSGHDALDAGRTAQARRELRIACRYAPTRLSNWLYWLLALLPTPVFRALQSGKRRLAARRNERK